MIEIKEEPINSLLDKAIQRANLYNDTQLVSLTKKVDKLDPVLFFEAAKQTNKDRIFWSSTIDDFYIVGVGKAYEIIAEESRFEMTKKQWSELLDKAIIHNPYDVPGTGILALGGMSFDPKKERTNLWKNYNPSKFTVPEYTLTKNNNKYYITTTMLVQSEDTTREIIAKLEKLEKQMLTNSVHLPSGATIIEKEEIKRGKWLESVHGAIDEIKSERAKKIVIAREMRLKLNKQAEISVMLKRLLKMQPTSYVFAFEKGEDCFIGATPERLVKIEGSELLSTCLAGTAPRGKTSLEDEKIRKEFLKDEKNLEEHRYVVQMIKNSIAPYCNNLVIPDKPTIYPLKDLQHLYTPVTATLKQGESIFDIIEKLHPTPALGGVPGEESLIFIRENEHLDRGWYGAPIGWLDARHNGEFAVGLRSGLIQGDEASLFAGGGIMRDSDPETEYEETNIKFLPMLSVMEENYESH